MKCTLRVHAAAFAISLGAAVAPASAAEIPYTGHGKHVMVQPERLTWGEALSVGPGVQIAVIEGPLNKEGAPFTFRLRIPAGTVLAPHTHPAYERVTVLSGTLHFAHGKDFDRSKTMPLPVGSVAIMPPGEPMFGYTTEETVIQLHGEGPWGITYIDPEDDPRKKGA